MNINLISPDDNGHKFTVRFKEDIVIPKDSKVYLNYATLTRRGNFEFTRDQQLYLVIPQNTTTAEQSDPSANVLPTRNGAVTGANFNFNIPLYNSELAPPAVSNVGVATIPAGEYDYSSMLNAISTALNSILSNSNNGSNLELYRALGEGDLDEKYDDGIVSHDVAYGLVKNNSLAGDPPLENVSIKDHIDPLNGLNMSVNADGDIVKTTPNVNKDAPNAGVAIWDNYMVSSRRYNFLNNLDTTPLGQMGICQFIGNKTYQELSAENGALCFGLFNKPYSVGIYGTNGAVTAGQFNSVDDFGRVRGNTAGNNQNDNNGSTFFNPPQLNYIKNGGNETSNNARQPFLKVAPFQVTIDGRNPTSKIVFTVNRNSNIGSAFTYTNHPNAGQNINNQKSVKTLTTNKGIPLTSDINIGILLYQTQQQAQRDPEFYQRNPTAGYMGVAVLNMNDIDQDLPLSQQGQAILLNKPNFFNKDYFIDNRVSGGGGLNPPLVDYGATATGGANRVLSQTPFAPFISSLKQNSGFEDVIFSPLTNGGDETNNPKTTILKYSMLASNDLANQIGLQSKVNYDRNRLRGGQTEKSALTNMYYPNGTTTDPTGAWGVKKTKMALLWRRIGYSVLLKNLPLQNYKNTQDTRDGGYSKNILANIPAPFQNTTIEYNTKSNHLVTASYEPSFKINNNMNNQPFSTNKFEVEIVNNKTDKPATELLNSVINFTIEPPENKQMDNTVKNI